MKSLLIGLVTVLATVAFANEGTATTAPAAAPTEQKAEMPKDAAHGAAEHKEAKAEKKAKKNKKTKTTEKTVEKTEKTEEAKH